MADHLHDDIDARMAAGLPAAAAAHAAVAAIGPADVVARSVVETMARSTLRRAFLLGTALFVAAIVCSDLVTSDFTRISAPWLSDGPGTLVIWVVGQVALVAGAVTVIRATAYTLGKAATAQLYIVHGMFVVTVCAALALGVGAAGVLTGPGNIGAERVLFVIAAGGAGMAAVTAAFRLNRTVEACLRSLGISELPDSTIAEDVYAAAVRLGFAARSRLPAAAPLLRAIARCLTRCGALVLGHAPWLADSLDTRRHPWRFAFLALTPLAALTVLYGIVHGLIVGSPASVAGPVSLAAFECALAVTGYAALGRYLALM
jgi:hypothetical protein